MSEGTEKTRDWGGIPPAPIVHALARCLVGLPLNGVALPPPYGAILAGLDTVEKAARPELLSRELADNGLEPSGIMDAIGRLDPEGPPPKESPPPRKTVFRADELLDTEFPAPRWTIPGLMSEGLVMLGGRPKMGKSWWALEASEAIGAGGRFMGKELQRGKVLYFALEDSPSRLQRRMKALNWPRGLDVTFVHDMAPIGGTIGGLPALIEAKKPALVVIDTLSRAAQGLDQRSVGAVSDYLGPIQITAVNAGCTVLIVDHLRKAPSGGRSENADFIDEFMESTAKTAVADCIMALFRKRGERGATLMVTGRDMEDQELAIEMVPETCSWQLLGDAEEVRHTDRARKILAALKTLGKTANCKSIAAESGLRESHVSSILGKLVEDGKVRQLPRIGKEQPYQIVENTGLGL
ncbi:MAG: AAA family ATPase [Actinobacteria bacterium]|nr:AAA family ATPase [Actinomycetota bacterium]